MVGAAGTLDKRFTNPRGDEAPRGLGLSERQIDEIADFVENGLYDPSFKDTFMPSENDLAYSKNRPDLAALGAKDGQLLSGRAIDNNDPLSRRDQGLEFLDVTGEVKRDLVEGEESRQNPKHVWRFTNTSESVVDTHLLVIVSGLPANVRLLNASGTTKSGEPYLRVFLPDGVLNPKQSITSELVFDRVPGSAASSYAITLLSGQGNP